MSAACSTLASQVSAAGRGNRDSAVSPDPLCGLDRSPQRRQELFVAMARRTARALDQPGHAVLVAVAWSER